MATDADAEIVIRKSGSTWARVDDDGTIRIKGRTVGRFESNGTIRKRGSSVGSIDGDGTIRRRGSSIGRIESDGTLRRRGSSIGRIESGGTIRKRGSTWGTASNCCGSFGSKKTVAAVMVSLQRGTLRTSGPLNYWSFRDRCHRRTQCRVRRRRTACLSPGVSTPGFRTHAALLSLLAFHQPSPPKADGI